MARTSSRRTAGATTRAGGEERWTKILVSAAALFAERGYDATSIRDIAQVAGLSKASVYHYVTSKDEIFYELALRSLSEYMQAGEDAIAAANDDVQAIELFSHAHVRTMLARETSIALTMSDTGALSDDQRRALDAERSHYVRLMNGILRRAQEHGVVRDDEPAPRLRLYLTSLLNGTVLGREARPTVDVDELAATAAALYLGGFAASPSGRAKKAPRPRSWQLENRLDDVAPAVTDRDRQLIETTVSLFRHDGYQRTTTRDISRALGLGNSSLYHHIADKEQLLYLIVASAYRDLIEAIESAVAAESDPVARITAFVTAQVQNELEHSDRSAVVLVGIRHLTEDRLARAVATRETLRTGLMKLIEDGQRVGAVRGDLAADTLARVMLGGNEWAIQWYRPAGDDTPEQIARLFAVVWASGVRVGSR